MEMYPMNTLSEQATKLYQDALYYHLLHQGYTTQKAQLHIKKVYIQKQAM